MAAAPTVESSTPVERPTRGAYMTITNEELHESIVKLWDAHTALKVEYERHDSWAQTRWDEYDREIAKVDKSIRRLLGEVQTLNIITAVSKTKLGTMFALSNALGGAIVLLGVWLAKFLGGR